jgi:hypothetical protein
MKENCRSSINKPYTDTTFSNKFVSEINKLDKKLIKRRLGAPKPGGSDAKFNVDIKTLAKAYRENIDKFKRLKESYKKLNKSNPNDWKEVITLEFPTIPEHIIDMLVHKGNYPSILTYEYLRCLFPDLEGAEIDTIKKLELNGRKLLKN